MCRLRRLAAAIGAVAAVAAVATVAAVAAVGTAAAAAGDFPAANAAAPRLVTIEPAAQVLPATTLRWYLVFDRPARGWVHQDAVHLLRADGKPEPAAFMDFGQELWSADGRRLTLLFDPGRVKRDVQASGSQAAPLQPGGRYRIALGGFEQAFRVGPPLRAALDPAAWHLQAPAGPDRALTLRFDRVMDAALAADQIDVVFASGRRVAGQGHLDRTGRVWRFTPDAAWQPGRYRVVLGAVLEDVSGNRLDEALDHAVGTAPARAARALRFGVAAPAAAALPAPSLAAQAGRR